MKRTVRFTLLILVALAAAPAAQQVSDNVPVLAVVKTTPPGQKAAAEDFIRGDLWGQRQGEPSIAVSTVNKDHILAFYNDFRAIDVPDDFEVPAQKFSLASVLTGVKQFFARMLGRPRPAAEEADLPSWLASHNQREAGIGMSVSYDFGITWTGGFVPGLSAIDQSDASKASPAYSAGMQGMSDPVVKAAPCGKFYLAHIAFVRGGASQILVSALRDDNDSETRHTIRWLGTTLVEQGNNGSNGPFVDKPDLIVIPNGSSNCSGVTETVVVSYTKFTGRSGGKFQSTITVATSTDGGTNFTLKSVDDSTTQNQGTALAVNPTNKDLYVFWRSFGANTIYWSKLPNGARGWSKPLSLLAADGAGPTITTFDQPTIATTDPGVTANDLTFRTNGFPVAAFAPNGRLFVAWQERWGGLEPRIVFKSSADGGGSWSVRRPVSSGRAAAEPGQGFFNESTTEGPQVIPSIGCGADSRCLVTFFESRTGLSGNDPILNQQGLWLGGFARKLDLRGVLLDATNPAPQRSFQISRYNYKYLSDGISFDETENSVESVNGVPALNYSGYPHTAAGTSPFMHDYNDVEAVVTFVKDSTGGWRAANQQGDAPYGAGFIAAWADNRHVVRPADGNWSNYGPPGIGGACTNAGSRNQDVITAQISLGLLVTSPTNYKSQNGTAPIEFPMTIWNNTGADRQFKVTIAGNASLSKVDSQTVGYVELFSYSSMSVNVYAKDVQKVTVSVVEVDVTSDGTATEKSGGLRGYIAFNAPESKTGAAVADKAPVAVTVVSNPVTRNPVTRNPVTRNPVTRNSVFEEVAVTGDVIDYSWTVNASNTDDTSAFVALANVDRAYADDYLFQVFITKPTYQYTYYTVNGVCEPTNSASGSLVAHVTDAANPVTRNPVTRNPVTRNPVSRNPVTRNTVLGEEYNIIQNSTFTIGADTGDGLSTTSSDTAVSSAYAVSASSACVIGACTMAAPRLPDEVTITLRAYPKTSSPTRVYNPELNPPSIVVAEISCLENPTPACLLKNAVGADLVAPASAAPSVTQVMAGQTVAGLFPANAVTIANNGVNSPGMTDGTARAPIRYGLYVSTADTVKKLLYRDCTNDNPKSLDCRNVDNSADGSLEELRNPDGTIKENSDASNLATTPVTRRVATDTFDANIPVGQSATIDPLTASIPSDLARANPDSTGTYYLYLYVDDTRQVSELDEDNNIIRGGPITVLPPEYKTTALMSPCSATGGTDCTRNGGGAAPLAWQFTDGVVPIDSLNTPPRLVFYQSNDSWAEGAPVGVANPGNISTGQSDFQYCDGALTYPLCTSRPAFTWQYNWNRTCPSPALAGATCTPGTTLTGRFLMFIEVAATGQTKAEGKALGPFKILLQ